MIVRLNGAGTVRSFCDSICVGGCVGYALAKKSMERVSLTVKGNPLIFSPLVGFERENRSLLSTFRDREMACLPCPQQKVWLVVKETKECEYACELYGRMCLGHKG